MDADCFPKAQLEARESDAPPNILPGETAFEVAPDPIDKLPNSNELGEKIFSFSKDGLFGVDSGFCSSGSTAKVVESVPSLPGVSEELGVAPNMFPSEAGCLVGNPVVRFPNTDDAAWANILVELLETEVFPLETNETVGF